MEINPAIIKAEITKSSGLFSSSFVEYTIKSAASETTVKRKFKHFEWMRDCLKNSFPFNYVTLEI